MVHSYPSLERVAEIRDAHECRVLFSAIGPAGDCVVTGAGDENLKFWRVWDAAQSGNKKKKEVQEVRGNGTKAGILSIR
jgi:cell division cycle protein 20 (cofactor of APC complex)